MRWVMSNKNIKSEISSDRYHNNIKNMTDDVWMMTERFKYHNEI